MPDSSLGSPLSTGSKDWQGTGIPADLYDRYSSVNLRHAYQFGDISYATAAKTVHIAWAAGQQINQKPTALKGPSYENLYLDRASQAFETRYFPSSVTVVSHEILLVAGKKENGKTVIERWSLDWPDYMPAPLVPVGGGLGHRRSRDS